MLITRHRDRIETRRVTSGLAVLLTIFVAACSSWPEAPSSVGRATGTEKPYTVNGLRYVPQADPDYDRVGTASWYGPRFHGRRTANGQRYDMHGMTAAHTTLPMGAQVKVTNLANGRSVVLAINDRGPFVRGRIIDVSRRAAHELGFLNAGVAKVRVQVVSAESPNRIQLAEPQSHTPNADHFLPVLNRAMESGAKLSEYFWTNPDNGNRGSIMPLTQPVASSEPFCRNYRRTAHDGTGNVVHIGRACRKETANWWVVRERKEGA